jgi:heat shock protein HtpX
MNFREQIKANNRKTKLVIATFIIIMCIVGLLADVVLNPIYPDSLSMSMMAFLRLEAFPYVTAVVTSITILGVFIITKFGHKLMLSGSQYKRLDNVDGGILSAEEIAVVNMVEEMSISAGMGYKPKVYIMETQEMNAFAAGWNEGNALVAVTRGLMLNLNRAEQQAVIAHEIGHIIHGDSKLTLYVGIMANVILTFTNIFAHIAWFIGGKGGGSAANKARLLIIVLNLVLPIITQILYLYLSRSREYMADAAAVKLIGDNQAMIDALKKISGNHEEMKYKRKSEGHAEGKEPKIGDNFRGAANIFETGDSIFSTHPSIQNRIEKLGGQIEE